jgi:hypothetical protein
MGFFRPEIGKVSYYLDDLIVAGNNTKQHLDRLEDV